jgi:hypothetical protein
MLFIHQQIQSFLNLGACKEYLIMAKPKLPKKTNDVNPTAFTTSATDANINSSDVTTPHISPPPMGSAQTTSTQSAAAARTALDTKTEPKRTAPKPEVVRSEARANLVPINIEEEIRRLAYLLAERRGFESGHETEDWLAAEHEIRQRYHQQSA